VFVFVFVCVCVVVVLLFEVLLFVMQVVWVGSSETQFVFVFFPVKSLLSFLLTTIQVPRLLFRLFRFLIRH
jgi:hypothetical protein